MKIKVSWFELNSWSPVQPELSRRSDNLGLALRDQSIQKIPFLRMIILFTPENHIALPFAQEGFLIFEELLQKAIVL